METVQKIIEGIIIGLFFSCFYIGGSFLSSYLSLYWDLWNPAYAWITVGVITYSCVHQIETKASIIGIILIIGLWISQIFTETIPLLWVYIVVNSIVCLNIIIACIKKAY